MTYQDFFKLKDTPFRLTPDVDYFFPSETHGAALETLLYSIKAGEAFVQITGQPGVGKTILVRHLLNQLEGEVRTALILHPRLDGEELLKVILEDLGVPAEAIQGKSKEGLLRFFREQLLDAAQKGHTTVVIIDEAQEIPNDTLEELRLLSNLETEKQKLLSIILVGQTELEQKLNNPALKQLHQRITIRYRVEPFSRNETQAYITHRLSIAGAAAHVHFSDGVLHAIHRKSGGIPRQINVICERALMAACVEGVKTIRSTHLKRALESYLGPLPGFAGRSWGLAAAVLLLLVLGGGGWWAFSSGYRFAVTTDHQRPQSSSQPQPQPQSEPQSQPQQTAAAETAAAGSGTVANKEQSGETGSSSPPAPPVATEASQAGGQEKVVTPPFELASGGWQCLVVNRLKNQGQVWQGDEKSMSQSAVFELQGDALEDGVYLLGKDKDNRPFLLNHQRFAVGQRYQELAQRLWEQFGGNSALPLIPLVVWSGKDEDRPETLVKDTEKIRVLVRNWAAAWRSLDIDAYIQYYSPTHFSYVSMRHEPTTVSKEQYYSQMGKNFQNNSYVSLQISEPVCIINPADPKSAVAIFSQKFSSARHVDEGIKVLFLREFKEKEDAEFIWKIEGRCWMPMPMDSKGKV
jgi:type II secretory pathway predicted ATPase ExeA